MFGRKKNVVSEVSSVQATMIVMPTAFYGGADPVVYRGGYSSGNEKKMNKIAENQPKINHLVNKKLLIGGVIFLVVSLGAVSGYYFWQKNNANIPSSSLSNESITNTTIPSPEVPSSDIPAASPTPTSSLVFPDAPPVADVPVSAPIPTNTLKTAEPRPIDFPKVTSVDAPDIDADSLTDREEEDFRTDSGVWDTDGDGYYDGQEVVNLYNPTGKAPIKIIESGVVKEYANPNWKYRIFYPATWELGEVDTSADQVLFSSAAGDYIEVRAVAKNKDEAFSGWFALNAKDQQYTDLKDFTNRFQEKGTYRKDNLVAYFNLPDKVFVVLYHSNGETNVITFRHVLQMMVASFRATQGDIQLPAQLVLPPPPDQSASTSTP